MLFDENHETNVVNLNKRNKVKILRGRVVTVSKRHKTHTVNDNIYKGTDKNRDADLGVN